METKTKQELLDNLDNELDYWENKKSEAQSEMRRAEYKISMIYNKIDKVYE